MYANPSNDCFSLDHLFEWDLFKCINKDSYLCILHFDDVLRGCPENQMVPHSPKIALMLIEKHSVALLGEQSECNQQFSFPAWGRDCFCSITKLHL